MFPRRSLLCCLALVLGGCERYPEDPIFAYGEVQHADGTPIAGLELSLQRAVALLNPQPQDPPPEFQPYAEATSGSDGRFTLEAIAGDTEHIEKDHKQFEPRFRLTLPLEDGQGTWVSFQQTDDVELPTLRPWISNLTRMESAVGPALTFSPPPAAPELPPTATVTSLLHKDGSFEPMRPPPVMWSFEWSGAASGSPGLPARSAR